MSSTTTEARPAAPARPEGRALPPAWTVLRLHRSALAIWIAFVALTAAALLWLRYGPEAAAALRFMAECKTVTLSGRCSPTSDGAIAFGNMDYLGTESAWLVRNIAPVVAGWAGAVLIGRELENGTAELAWTQSITPVRWLAQKLAVPAVLLIAGTGILVLQLRGFLDWAGAHRMLRAGYKTNDVFFAVGPALVAHALLGLTLGVLLALLTRRALPALALGAAATWTVSWLVGPWRTEIWPAVTRTAKGEGPFGYTAAPCDYLQSEHKYSIDACMGARPAANYWPGQLAETGFVFALAVLAAAAAFWLLRRRTG